MGKSFKAFPGVVGNAIERALWGRLVNAVGNISLSNRKRPYTRPVSNWRPAKKSRSVPSKPMPRQVARSRTSGRVARALARKYKRKNVAAYSRNATRKYQSTGRMGPKFRKPKRYTPSKYQTKGVVYHIESGGVVASGAGTDKQVLYVGHCIPVWQTYYCVCMYIVKLIWRKIGRDVTSFYDKVQFPGLTHIGSPGEVAYTYQLLDGGIVNYGNFAVAADSTYREVADSLFATFSGLLAGNDYCRFGTIGYVDSQGTHDSGMNLRVDLSQLILDVNTSMKLALQNRTLASSVVGGDETSMLDIANNPLGGKVYAGPGPGPIPKWRNNTVGGIGAFGDVSTGIIEWDVNQASFTADMTQQYSRPPPAGAFENCRTTRGVFLKPGEIKNSIISQTRKLYFNTMCNIFKEQAQAGSTDPTQVSWGNYRMYGFEKKVNTTVDEPAITVGYEHNLTFRCTGFFKKRITIPLQIQQ